MAKYQIIMSIARVEMDTLLSYQSRIKEVAKKDEELLILEGVVGIMITAQQQRHLSLENYNRLFECEEGNVNIILNFVIRWSLDFLQRFPNPCILNGHLRAEFLPKNVELDHLQAKNFINYSALRAKAEKDQNSLFPNKMLLPRTFRQYRRIGELRKAAQVQEELLEMLKYNVEDNFESFISVAKCCSDSATIFARALENFNSYSLPHLDPRKIKYYWNFINELGTKGNFWTTHSHLKSTFLNTLSTIVKFFGAQELNPKERIYFRQMSIFHSFWKREKGAIDRIVELHQESTVSRHEWDKHPLRMLFSNIVHYYWQTKDQRLKAILLKEWRTQSEEEKNYFYSDYHAYFLLTIILLTQDQQALAAY